MYRGILRIEVFCYSVPMKVLAVAFLVMVSTSVAGYFSWQQKKETDKMNNVIDFQTCAAAGYPVAESYPPQCRTPDGRSFTDSTPNAPSPIFIQDEAPARTLFFTAQYLQFSYPSDWNPVNKELPPGSTLESITLGIPGAVSDQEMAFSEIPYAALDPQDASESYPITIGGKEGKKWKRTGPGYVAYDYYTTGRNESESFGVHVTVDSEKSEIERQLDELVASIQFK